MLLRIIKLAGALLTVPIMLGPVAKDVGESKQLGKFDPDVRKAATESGDTEAAKAKIEAKLGPSGFMLFGTQDHGALLRLASQKRKAVQYIVGNPLFAFQAGAAIKGRSMLSRSFTSS